MNARAEFTQHTIDAEPYPWPYNGDLQTRQHGADHHRHADRLLRRRAAMSTRWVTTCRWCGRRSSRSRRLLSAMRARRASTVIHTREGHRPDLADLPANKRWRSRQYRGRHRRSRSSAGASWCAASRAGRSSPTSYPIAGEPIIDKPGKGSFCATDLELILRHSAASRTSCSPASPPTSACTPPCARPMTAAIECMMLEDCCGATDFGNHLAAMQDDQDAGRRLRHGVEFEGARRATAMRRPR